ncbi:hypothetical protein [Pseudomonas sp. KU43P]|uniref:hypothetical protein n=1 Tax=Pseudomonas sp. KU43P TaxID=2487887 RepID=UPI0012AA8563|nr:hypothetical protein [Pseudomonas sp. KU43P]BBH44048.1 hypothetical protein KU43P_05250 [Pseudomonas sp. KU43P]
MSEARSYINPHAQSYESLKADTPMNANQRAKFDVLNAHIVNSVVFPGELVIVGDPTTPSCTSHEAYLMGRAAGIHLDIELNGGGVDDFFLDNFEFLQSLLSHAAMGAGAATDGWARHMGMIKSTLEQIEQLHRSHLSDGQFRARDEFYAKRRSLFMRLGKQLDKAAAFGSGLRNQGAIKRVLGISTKSYLSSGEISRYAEKVAGVAKATSLIKKGVYIGLALDVAATGLAIQRACTLGREEDCRKAKFVLGGGLVGGAGGSIIGGSLAGAASIGLCSVVFGIPTVGTGAVACAVVGGAIGGKYAGEKAKEKGEQWGELIYEQVSP